MLLETFPWLTKFSWAPWMKMFRNRQRGRKFFYNFAKEAAEENPNENYSRDLFQNFKSYNLKDEESKSVLPFHSFC